MSSAGRALWRIAVPVCVLALGIGTFVFFVSARPEPKKRPASQRGALVETAVVHEATENLRIQAQGTVVPARQVALQPEITGRVVWQSERLLPGGRFKKGEPLLRIDPSDYQLSLRQQAATIRSAEAELRIEQSRQQVAEREWEIIDEDADATDAGRAVALREPQREAAQATLERARAAHEQATLALGRSVLTAPFNGFIRSESVEVGQLISPATQLGTLVGSDEFWVQVSIPVDKLRWLKVPGMNTQDGEGSRATVTQELGSDAVRRSGRVLRVLGDLDPVGRMARLLVAIDDPLQLTSPGPDPGKVLKESSSESGAGTQSGAENGPTLPLLLGSYVEVSLESESLQSAVEIPRRALQGGDRVFIYGSDARLHVREVGVLWRRPETVLVTRGLQEGDRIVLSRVPGAVDGLPLRLAQAAPSPGPRQRTNGIDGGAKP